jgi:hypothetical protein
VNCCLRHVTFFDGSDCENERSYVDYCTVKAVILLLLQVLMMINIPNSDCTADGNNDIATMLQAMVNATVLTQSVMWLILTIKVVVVIKVRVG